MGIIKSHSDRKSLQEAGKITEQVLHELGEMLAPDVSTLALETKANQMLSQARSTAPFKTYHGFNQAICVSINEEIVNGPPSRGRLIRAGDVVSIATAAEHRGIHAKAARTFYVGKNPAEPPTPEPLERLLKGTEAVLLATPRQAEQAQTLNDLLTVVPNTAKTYGLTVIQNLGGAGIGKKLHDAPATPNTPEDLQAVVPLEIGLCFTIMPMFSIGPDPTYQDHADGWTLVTGDGSCSAHFADTFLVTEQGLVNITRSGGD